MSLFRCPQCESTCDLDSVHDFPEPCTRCKEEICFSCIPDAVLDEEEPLICKACLKKEARPVAETMKTLLHEIGTAQSAQMRRKS